MSLDESYSDECSKEEITDESEEDIRWDKLGGIGGHNETDEDMSDISETQMRACELKNINEYIKILERRIEEKKRKTELQKETRIRKKENYEKKWSFKGM